MNPFMTHWLHSQPTLLASLTHDVLHVLLAVFILIIGWWLSRRLGGLLARSFGRTHADPTLIPMLSSVGVWAVRALAIMAALGEVGVATASVLAVLGAAGLAIGLALQGTLQNIAAGLMLLFLRPFRAGDVIEGSGAAMGIVREVGLFTTRLERGDGNTVFVPNSQIWSNPVTNYSQGGVHRLDLPVRLDAGVDVGAAIKTIQGWLGGEPRVLAGTTLAPVVMIHGYRGDGGVDLDVRVWTRDPDPDRTRQALLDQVQQVLRAASASGPAGG